MKIMTSIIFFLSDQNYREVRELIIFTRLRSFTKPVQLEAISKHVFEVSKRIYKEFKIRNKNLKSSKLNSQLES